MLCTKHPTSYCKEPGLAHHVNAFSASFEQQCKRTLRQKYNERISSPLFHGCCMVLVEERPLLSAVGHPVLLMASTIHLPHTSLPFSIFIFCPGLLSLQGSRTLGRLISSQIIKALQPGLVVYPVLDLFWDAIVCRVITSFVSPTVAVHAWSQ